MSRWQKTCGNAFNLAVFSSRKVQGPLWVTSAMAALPPKAHMCNVVAHVCFGSKADICSAKRHVRFTPESRHARRRPH
jgi:hypothetical protein